MKTLVNMISYALIVLVSVCVSMSLASCGADESFSDNRIAPPAPKDTTKVTPTPDPKPSFIWDGCMDQNVKFYPETDSVLATNIWQVTENGEAKFVDAVMRYKYEIDFTAPTRVVTSAQDTTVYAGGGLFKSDYSNFRRVDKDSLWNVNSYIEGGYKTQYYTMSLKTSRMEGIDLRGGKENRYFNVSETPTIKSIWHEDIYEVESNDSIFNRETVHNVLLITLTGTKGNKWYVTREKVVIVDHFIKLKGKEEKEEEEVKADDYLKDLARFISATKVYNTDTRKWGDAYLFEGSESYKIYIKWYTSDDKYLEGQDTKVEVPFTTCPRSDKYNAVAYIKIKGGFYPGKISPNGKLWDVGCAINGVGYVQGYGSNMDDIEGIKNFVDGNSAYPSPYIAATPSVRTVKGYKIISVTGKTSVHTSKVTIADSSLK